MSEQTVVNSGRGPMNFDFSNPNSDPFNGTITNTPIQDDPEESGNTEEVIDPNNVIDPNQDPEESGNSDVRDDTQISDNDTQEVEHEEEPNIYPYIAEQLRKDGFIDSEVNFDDKVDGMTVYNAFKDKLQKETEPIIRQQAVDNLRREGFDENDLLMARALRQGVDPRLLAQASRYELYSNLADTAPDEDKISIISQMYKERGLDDDEVKGQIAIAEQNDKVGDLFNKSKAFFGEKFQSFKAQEDARTKQDEEIALTELRKAEDLINRVVTSQELYGEKLTPQQAKDINDSIRSANQLVEVDGVKYKASELQKFMIDFNNDPEFRLFAFKLFKFREVEKTLIKEEAKKELDKDLFDGYKQKVIKSTKYSNNKQVTETLNQQRENKTGMFSGNKMNINLG
jgi:hypothetical protein